MLLIMTSLHSDGNQCYVETANIDGETNLKLKEAPSDIKKLLKKDAKVTDKIFKGFFEFSRSSHCSGGREFASEKFHFFQHRLGLRYRYLRRTGNQDPDEQPSCAVQNEQN
jgi:magnesium-transporting ATPase (P-type)